MNKENVNWKMMLIPVVSYSVILLSLLSNYSVLKKIIGIKQLVVRQTTTPSFVDQLLNTPDNSSAFVVTDKLYSSSSS